MHFLKLTKVAEDNLAKGDPTFLDKVGRTTGILRAKGIVPFRRATVNGRLHWLLGAILVSAKEMGETIDVAIRRKGELHQQGHSTMYLDWLDNLVKEELLVPANGQFISSKKYNRKAVGGFAISAFLQEQIM